MASLIALPVSAAQTTTAIDYFEGKVGIKTNPSYDLDVVGDVNATGSYRLGGSYQVLNMTGNALQVGAANVGSIDLKQVTRFSDGRSTFGLQKSLYGSANDTALFNNHALFVGSDAQVDRGLQFGVGSSSSYSWIQAWANANATGNMILQMQGGSVGIGKSIPAATLDVNGNAIVSKALSLTPTVDGSGLPSVKSITVSSPLIDVDKSIIRLNPGSTAVQVGLSVSSMVKDGQILVLKVKTTSQNGLITLRDANIGLTGAANIKLASPSVALGNDSTLTLMYDALDSKWIEIARSINQY